MVWFECTDCGESLKKPKVQNHTFQCSASAFNCIDCGRTFDRNTVKEHTTCVTEHDKYAKGATKPGGYAAQGFYGGCEAAKAAAEKQQQAAAPSGTEFLSAHAPWRCSVCSVTCTSRETLMGHAAGAKHKRRARAASKGKEEAATAANAAKEAAPAALPAATGAPLAAAATRPAQMPGGQPESNGHAQPSQGGMRPKKGRKRKAEQAYQEDKRQQGEPSEAGERHSAPQRQKENGSSAGGHDKAPKWKKLATEVLQGRKDRRMKVAKLQEKVLSASGIGTDAQGDHSTAMLRRWANSAKFLVQDGYVSLT